MKRTPLKRKTPLRKEGAKGLREQATLAQFRRDVRANAGGLCQGATPACPPTAHVGTDAHHLAPSDRDAGRHDAARGVLLCRQGHSWVHSNPAEAERRRLLIRSGVA